MECVSPLSLARKMTVDCPAIFHLGSIMVGARRGVHVSTVVILIAISRSASMLCFLGLYTHHSTVYPPSRFPFSVDLHEPPCIFACAWQEIRLGHSGKGPVIGTIMSLLCTTASHKLTVVCFLGQAITVLAKASKSTCCRSFILCFNILGNP